MFLTINSEVIWSLKSQNHASCPPLLLNVSWRERTVRASALRVMWPPWYFITRCYGKQVEVFGVAVATGDIIKYQSFLYGSFVWGIHVRYNNIKYQGGRMMRNADARTVRSRQETYNSSGGHDAWFGDFKLQITALFMARNIKCGYSFS